jgi:hypothetical protein
VEPKAKRTAALRIRLTEAEHRTIVMVAQSQGLGICTFARVATIRAAGLADKRQKRRKPNEAQRLLAECLGQLARIGSNVNQAARALNSGWDCDPVILQAMAWELRALREAMVAAVSDLSE